MGLFSSAFLFNSLPVVQEGSTDVHPQPRVPPLLSPGPPPQVWESVAETEDGFHLADSGSSSFQAEAESFVGWNFPRAESSQSGTEHLARMGRV